MSTFRMFKAENVKSIIARNARNLKLCLAVAFAALSATNANAQATVVTIGTGTTSQYYMPCNNFYRYTYSQQIYTAAELNTGGQPMEITSIAFQYNYSSAMTAKTNCTIYMANTSKTSFSSTTDWVQYSNLTPVYTGSMNCSAGAGTYTTFTLTTPFTYDGTSSLLVCVHDNSGSYNSNTYTYRASSATNQALHVYQDGSTPYAITGSFSTSGTRPSYKSNIRLTMQPLTCPGIANLAISGTTLSWTERGTATQWLVEYGSVGFTPGTGTTVLVSGTPSYSFASLSSGIYSFYVRSYCSPGDTSRYYGPVTAAHNFNFCGGAGTQANPYLICNETDLRNLSTCVNAGVSYSNTYFRLVNNIAMAQGAFTPIGSLSAPFRGHFDGNNKSITNLSMTNTTGDHNGLFGMLIGGSIKNLTVGGTVAGGDTTGGIVGSAINSVISGCTNNATVSGAFRAHGGIAGAIRSTKVLDCRNTGNISDNAYEHGGIVGDAYDKSAIRRCVNTGTITGTNSNGSNYYHGGIVGRFYNTTASGDTVGVFACRNTVAIGGYYYTGGIAGYMYYGNVDSCYNTGAVTGYYYTGGIGGYSYYSKYRRCSNRANVSSTYYYLGGIVGYLYGNSSNYGYVQYCVNTGHVSQTNTGYYTAGIAGYTNYAYIEYNSNSGDVLSNCTAASSYVGGIVAYGITSAYVRYNINGGYVKGSGGYVGGIIGYGSTNTTYNLNVNNVKGSSNTAAICGYGSCATNNYWDKQMCPTTYLYSTTANASCAKTTAELVGVATYPGTAYFTATANMYPIPTQIRDSLGAKLAATPIFLTNSENVGDVKHNFTVGTTNSVSWTSSVPSVISVSGANATVAGFGSTQLTGTTSGMQKHIWIYNIPTFCGGSGTQADPYLICTANTLDTLAQCVNGGMDFNDIYFKVVNDLDLSSFSNWRVIGETMATPFKGHFDGNNKTISNLKITGTTQYRGLFGVVLGSSTTQKADVHHLTVKGEVSGGSYTGGVIGYCDYTNVKSVKNYANISGSYTYHGGLVGRAYYYCRFDSCENHGHVQGSGYSGGILGEMYYNGSIRNSSNDTTLNFSSNYTGGIVGNMEYYDTIVNCVNTGDVLSTSYMVGGIAGRKYYYGYIRDCRNSGNISGTYNNGGIVGYMYSYQFIRNCHNTGNLATSTYHNGGIAGYYYCSGNSSQTSIYVIDSCTNTGNVTGSYYVGGIVGNGYGTHMHFCENRGNVTATSYGIGGIMGYNYYYGVIAGCNNYGNVSSSYVTSTYTSTGYGVGGIAGCTNYNFAANMAVIDSCNNYGDVSSAAYLTGGIAGQNYYYGYVRRSHNYGKVSGTYYVGGISGFTHPYTNTTATNAARIEECGNAGDVEGTYYVGGIVGRNGYSSSSYYAKTINSVNIGRVKGTNYVGGIAGQNYGQSNTTYRPVIQGCLNAGIVEATTNYAGGICGQTFSSTSYGIVQYCINVGKVITPGTYKGAIEANSVAPTTCYYDTLMCPIPNYYYNVAAGTTYAKRTSALTDGTFNPSATYFTATNGLYPRPTSIANHPITIVAATPVFLDETTSPTNHVENVNTCYTVGTGNNVSWSSSDPSETAITGSDGVILAVSTPTITATKDTIINKEVDLNIVSLPAFGTFTYPAISDTIGKTISGIRPSLSSGCTFLSTDLPYGLTLNASNGEISGRVYDTLHTTFTVTASCTGCVISQATVRIDIYPKVMCPGYTITLPAGITWFYDANYTDTVVGNTAVVDSNTTFYSRGPSGTIVNDFQYTGAEQRMVVSSLADSVVLQVWGAEGGSGTGSSTTLYAGGLGGYSKGTLGNAAAGQTLYVYVGGKGPDSRAVTTTNQPYTGGWNGGGAAGTKTYTSSYYQGGSGGGGTDIRIGGNTLYSRVIVAGGGGGTGYTSSYYGGVGGGTAGGDNAGTHSGKGGTQTAGGAGSTSGGYAYGTSITSGVNGQAGSFGQGGNGGYGTSCSGGAGGGGGWYGGGGGKSGSSTSEGGAGGGSGYVYTSASAGDYPSGCLLNSNYYLTNAQTIAGNQSFESTSGGAETGHEGNGYARVTSYYSVANKIIVNTLPRITAQITCDTTICGSGATANITIRFTGGAPYRYRITGDNADRTANSDVVTIQVSPTTSTLYYVTYVKSTVTGCEAVQSDLRGVGMVEVCGSSILCQGDSLALPANYTWYTDAQLTNAVSGKVAPNTNTTYYRSGNVSYNVVVMPRSTATILDTVYNVCADSTAHVIINFTGYPPFTYRITGDRADRTTYNYTERVPVYTDTSAIVKVISFSDLNTHCPGLITHSNAQIILCDQPIICYGDTVWLPAGQWYYDFNKTRPITTPYVIPDQTTIYYLKVNDTTDFSYTGDVQEYTVPGGTDSVFMQVWGAQGGASTYHSKVGGKGGFSEGRMSVSGISTLYVYVGGKGNTGVTSVNGGWNGGGGVTAAISSSSANQHLGSGGGATDISTIGGACTLDSYFRYVRSVASYGGRVIVAGGGGGAEYGNGTAGGGTAGEGTYGGTQSAAGTAYNPNATSYVTLYAGGLGYGVSTTGGHHNHAMGACGGGGYYGGGAYAYNGSQSYMQGFGGSGYVGTLNDARTVVGTASFPSPSGSTETGHEGDGYARIIAKGSREFTVLVLDNTVATMRDTTLNICNNQSAQLEINFQGTSPFAYRITGDTVDRICNTHQAHVTVSPTVTTNYQVTYVQGDVCEGKTSNTFTTVMVCNQPIICAGDTAYLPTGSTWYYDANMTQAVADTFVTPTVTTTYYGNNNATFTVTVNPVATLSILSNTYNICDSTAVLQLYFTGTTPYYYRITGDTADRTAYSDTVYIPVSPDTTTQYHVTAFRDVYCQGSFNNDMATVIICDQPIICKGDTVWLDSTKTWFYDSTLLDTIRTRFVVPTQTTVYYNGGGSGGDTLNFRYTGAVQTYTVPRGVDSVFMQVWGAEGGQTSGYSSYVWEGGKGGYSQGKMAVTAGDVLNIYVGQKGNNGTSGISTTAASFNGGGGSEANTSSSYFHGGGGGGGTDIRVNSTALLARVIVAGGGGGAGYGVGTLTTGEITGGYGGGTTGTQGTYYSGYQNRMGGAGTQTSGGAAGTYTSGNGTAGTFGVGGTGGGGSASGSGGGGGWYGGGGGNYGSACTGSGGGGSGYVYTAATASNYPSGCLLNSSRYLTDAQTVVGNTAFPDTSFRGTTETGHQGNGYARIVTIGPLTQTYRVTVKPSNSDTIRDTICAGASFTHNDSVYTVQGTYYQYFESYDHCDSIEVIEVTVNDTLRDTIHPIICTGVTFDTNYHLGCVPVNGQTYAPYWRTGVYTQYLRDTVTGCFQNFVIDLTVSDTIRDTVWHTICPSGHFTINNETYWDTGTYRQHLYTAGGCDSILAIVIDRSDTLRETIYRNMCFGSYFSLNGQTYYDTGVYKQPLSNLDGCDSILTLVLTYSDTLRDTIHPIICAGDTLTHNGYKYFRTGLYNQYYVSDHGCDSLFYIDLTVRDTIFGHVYDTICAGASVTYNGETFTLPGDYHQVLQSVVHCDSFLTVHLYVNDTLRDTIYQTVCAGQTITVNDSVYWIQGEYKQWLRDPQTDCYHNYVIYLNVNDTIRDTIEPWVCAGQTFYWNRVPYTIDGWYRQEFRTPEGCDSILHIHLIVGDTLRDTVYFSVCSGHTLTHNNVTYDSTGWYRQNLKNFDDCDSILHIHLTIEDTIRGHVYDTICYGDTYTFNGSTYYIPGIYPYVTRTLDGCDSIAYLHLHVNDTIITHVYDTICRDDRYYYLDTSYDATGDYPHVLQRTTGCDSTVILHLFERDSIQSTIYDTICNNTTYNYHGQILNRNGRYPYRYESYTGCDSIVWLQLKVLEPPIISILDSGAYCEGDHATLKANTNGNYITWTSSPYDPTLNGQDHNFTIYVAPDRYTEYTATVDIRPYNCHNTDVHALNKPAKVEARISMSPEEITAENLQATFTDVSVGTIMYREWLFHENLPTVPDHRYFNRPVVTYTSHMESDSLEVTLIVTNDEGCYDTAVRLFPIFRGDVWVPNAFTPGRIGANRLLRVGYYNLLEYELFIYTREGLLVFHSTDPEISWDGTYNYRDCKAGSYVYVLHYRTKSRPSESYEKKGSVLLIR